jgi:histone H1/5
METRWKIEFTPTLNSQLNRSIKSGADKGTFSLPKGMFRFHQSSSIRLTCPFYFSGPSGKVKLAPKNDSAKENKPISKGSKTAKAPAKAATKAATTKAVTGKASKAKAAPKVGPKKVLGLRPTLIPLNSHLFQTATAAKTKPKSATKTATKTVPKTATKPAAKGVAPKKASAAKAPAPAKRAPAAAASKAKAKPTTTKKAVPAKKVVSSAKTTPKKVRPTWDLFVPVLTFCHRRR